MPDTEQRPERPLGTRWSWWFKKWVVRRDVDLFILDLIQVCRKHKFALSVIPNPRPFGTILVSEYRPDTIEMLVNAEIGSSAESYTELDGEDSSPAASTKANSIPQAAAEDSAQGITDKRSGEASDQPRKSVIPRGTPKVS